MKKKIIFFYVKRSRSILILKEQFFLIQCNLTIKKLQFLFERMNFIFFFVKMTFDWDSVSLTVMRKCNCRVFHSVTYIICVHIYNAIIMTSPGIWQQ